MKIELHDVAKGPARARALDPVSTAFETGTATLVEAETEQRPTVLGLIASGRMRPDAGSVLVDGAPNARTIRTRTALVDAPEVCDPAPNVAVIGLVEEELMFAGRPANLLSARNWLNENGFAHLGRLPIADVAPRERIALLLELTALRRRVEAMVLVSPDRHGGDPREWWQIVQGFAARGYAVLVVAGRASALVLQALDAAAPATVTPDDERTGDADRDAASNPEPTAEPESPEAMPEPATDRRDDADDETTSTEPPDEADADEDAAAAEPTLTDPPAVTDEDAADAASTSPAPEHDEPDAPADGSDDEAETDEEGGR